MGSIACDATKPSAIVAYHYSETLISQELYKAQPTVLKTTRLHVPRVCGVLNSACWVLAAGSYNHSPRITMSSRRKKPNEKMKDIHWEAMTIETY